MFGPAKLPQDIRDKLFAAVPKALADPQVREKLLGTGNEAAPSKSPAEFDAWATPDGQAALDRVKEGNVTVD